MPLNKEFVGIGGQVRWYGGSYLRGSTMRLSSLLLQLMWHKSLMSTIN